GIYAHASYLFNDRLPLNDANTVYNPSYQVANAKIGYRSKLGKHFDLDVFAGVNNFTDSHYSSFTALNAASYGGALPAYFNPSPGVNAYGGLHLQYVF